MRRFSRADQQPRDKVMMFRVSDEEKEFLEGIAARLELRSSSELIRVAIDYFLEHSQDGKKAQQSVDRS